MELGYVDKINLVLLYTMKNPYFCRSYSFFHMIMYLFCPYTETISMDILH